MLKGDPEGETTVSNEADFRKLLELTKPGEFGELINTSDTGPLGPLWADTPPQWFLVGHNKMSAAEPDLQLPDAPRGKDDVMRQVTDCHPEPLINVCFEDSGATEHEIEMFLSYIAETYREIGGRRLKVVFSNTLLPKTAEVVE